MFFYNYDNRMDALGRILRIQNDAVKHRALSRFIAEERGILRGLTPPADRSQVLTIAIRNENRLEREMQQIIAEAGVHF